MRTWASWLVLGLAVFGAGSSAQAYYLGGNRDFDLRARVYSQLGIMMDNAEKDQPTRYKIGDLAQHRNFYNPEFDARLTKYMRWTDNVPGLSLLSPDEFKFRFAWWGFYDGIYDYLDPEWNNARKAYKARFAETDNVNKDSFLFNDQNKNPRHVYASRNRINELYLDYTKGRLFTRAGRQAISWGESDDIALLDVTNLFDLTLGVPGLIQDLEEARIPVWALRNTVKMFDDWGALSSGFLDTYVVPGVVDTTVPTDPITAGVSPFNPDVADPQNQVTALGGPAVGKLLHLDLVSHQPAMSWANTRWGVRLQSLLLREYTLQGWFYRTFNQAPVPLLSSPGGLNNTRSPSNPNGIVPIQIDDRGFRVSQCSKAGFTPDGRPCSKALALVTVLERRLESVGGVSASWFSPALRGVIRTEAEAFVDELAFIPEKNLNPRGAVPGAKNPDGSPVVNTIPKTDYLRWVIGYDTFFFFRPLNPQNSFVLVTAWHGQWNLLERRGRDFRYLGEQKPGQPATVVGRIPGVAGCEKPGADGKFSILCQKVDPKNFEDQYKFDNQFMQIALQTDYLHGRLEPRLVALLDVTGIFGLAPSVVYRLTDNVLLSANYVAIEGSRRAGLATFRGHDILQFKVQAQLN
ncbi:MAG: hypothetical protein E6J57_01950 [Deltaproteobacteria bacterium]|nr:MAG: hypothetical protein E6J57_01950 [Deltaproteobacteria bacterium]